jgi:hypothetical protein
MSIHLSVDPSIYTSIIQTVAYILENIQYTNPNAYAHINAICHLHITEIPWVNPRASSRRTSRGTDHSSCSTLSMRQLVFQTPPVLRYASGRRFDVVCSQHVGVTPLIEHNLVFLSDCLYVEPSTVHCPNCIKLRGFKADFRLNHLPTILTSIITAPQAHTQHHTQHQHV